MNVSHWKWITLRDDGGPVCETGGDIYTRLKWRLIPSTVLIVASILLPCLKHYFPTMESITRLFHILGPRATTGLAVLAGYLLLVRKLRHLRRDREHAAYPYKTRDDLSKMTAEHAWAIVKYCMTLEFPFMSEKALAFALFKYGGPVDFSLPQSQMLT